MSYTTFFGDTFEDEHDEELTHKFGDPYKYFKKQYPGLHKLPTEEVRGIYSEFKKSPYGDTFEKSVDRTKQYIETRMPTWQKQYINPQPQPQTNMNAMQPMQNFNTAQQGLNAPQTNQNNVWTQQMPQNMNAAQAFQPQDIQYVTAERKIPLAFAQLAQQKQPAENTKNDEVLIDVFYDHLVDPNIEGYKNFLYCDSVGKPTSGAGLQITGPEMLKKFTTSSQSGTISPSNPTHTAAQQKKAWDTQKKYCARFFKGVDEKGKEKWKVPSAENQQKEFFEITGQPLTYFQDDELERETKKFIREDTLPNIRKNFKNVGLDFDNLLNQDGQKGNMDMMYSLGVNKFKLGCGSIEDGCWPGYTEALKKGDFELAAEQSHRKGINECRNDKIKNLILNGRH